MATINQFGIPGVGSGILQPKLKNRWRVTFIGMGGEGSSSQPVSHQAITVNRPTLRFDEVELNRYNSRAYVAGRHEWEPMNVTIEDDVTGSASKIVNEQIQKQQFLIGAEGPFLGAAQEGSIYKFATKIEMLDGKEQVIERWVMQGCFVQNVEYGELDYGSSEAVLINLTLRFDHAFQEIEGYNAGEGIALGGAGS
ncbi:MAG: hypothetical protein JXR12_15095 [Neptunomonas phycophila]|uniref:hypothetical protein n=1 Tax=Neptunomonas phycophila TaxID=1572645 RepID=UPI003B8BDBDA